MSYIAGVVTGVILGGVLVGVWVLFKTREPDPETEHKRGYDDAKQFHQKGLGVWQVEGYVRTANAMGSNGPYEAGMQQYVNEVLKR